MADRKLSQVELDAENAAKELATMPDAWFKAGVQPLPVMRAIALLRQLGARVARVEKDLAAERRQHRETEQRVVDVRRERDIARSERDARLSLVRDTAPMEYGVRAGTDRTTSGDIGQP
jgi:hypothetical protein